MNKFSINLIDNDNKYSCMAEFIVKQSIMFGAGYISVKIINYNNKTIIETKL